MKEILKQVTVAEFPEFKRRTLEQLPWKPSQFNDRKIGRCKIKPEERVLLQCIVDDMHRTAAIQQKKITGRIYCNSDCMLYEYRHCPFDNVNECPKYQPLQSAI